MKLFDRFRFAFFILFKGGENMAALYVFMITNQNIPFTFANVPEVFRPQVKLVLDEMGVGELAVIE